jgi:hypothetical protein
MPFIMNRSRQKYIIAVFLVLQIWGCSETTKVVPTGTPIKPQRISASNESGTHKVERAFDGSTEPDNFWENTAPFDLDVEFSEPVAIRQYDFLSGEEAHRMPRNWKLLSSADGQTWKVIDEPKQVQAWATSETRTYTVANPGEARQYRITFDSSFEPSNTLRLYEIHFYK